MQVFTTQVGIAVEIIVIYGCLIIFYILFQILANTFHSNCDDLLLLNHLNVFVLFRNVISSRDQIKLFLKVCQGPPTVSWIYLKTTQILDLCTNLIFFWSLCWYLSKIDLNLSASVSQSFRHIFSQIKNWPLIYHKNSSEVCIWINEA